MIGKLGYTAGTVHSGSTVAACVQKQAVDALLPDMIMGLCVDGLETFRRIIHIHPDQKTVIAAGCAKTERVTEARHLIAGVCVRTPCTLATIGKAFHQVLHGLTGHG